MTPAEIVLSLLTIAAAGVVAAQRHQLHDLRDDLQRSERALAFANRQANDANRRAAQARTSEPTDPAPAPPARRTCRYTTAVVVVPEITPLSTVTGPNIQN